MWTPDQQRITPQARRAAQHPGHETAPMVIALPSGRVNRIPRMNEKPGETGIPVISQA
jgi:hypothetical protein